MKVSRTWLQKYFDTELPDTEKIAEALTFHSSEVEEIQGDTLDVKVLPDRAAYALSHRGIASEVAAALDIPMKADPLRDPVAPFPQTAEVSVTVCDPILVPRYMGALVRGVKIGPSPAWLKEAIESVGQRSINNVVDTTNYVMLDLGQPLHAFDASLLASKDGSYAITVRKTIEGETITTLTGEAYVLPEDTLLIADGHSDVPLAIAGIKGGKAAEVTEGTTDLLVESANFDGTTVRRTAQAIKLWTDASLRFQNRLSPELVGYGMRAVLALITEVAGGEVIGVTDAYAEPAQPATVTAARARINGVLGTDYSMEEIASALVRLRLTHRTEGDGFVIDVPFERRDLVISEDVAEEVGRILGYDRLGTPELPVLGQPDQRRYHGLERLKDILLERGYIELSTQSFTETGDIMLANPLQMDRPALRPDLAGNMRDALMRAKREAPRTLGPQASLKLFELGTVFTKQDEHLSLVLGYEALSGKRSASILDEDLQALADELPELSMPKHDGAVAELSLAVIALESLGEDYVPKRIVLGPYQPFSIYPFALRDIAVWTPAGTEESEVALRIQGAAGDLLLRMDQFDRFEKDDRISYAFRLVFEAGDRTLSDADLDPVMQRVTEALDAQDGWEVR